MRRELAFFLAELSCDAPLALIIDDVHWADTSTVELLAYLARREDLNGVVFLLAYRPTEMSLASHPFCPNPSGIGSSVVSVENLRCHY